MKRIKHYDFSPAFPAKLSLPYKLYRSVVANLKNILFTKNFAPPFVQKQTNINMTFCLFNSILERLPATPPTEAGLMDF